MFLLAELSTHIAHVVATPEKCCKRLTEWRNCLPCSHRLCAGLRLRSSIIAEGYCRHLVERIRLSFELMWSA